MSIYEIHKFDDPQLPFILHIDSKIRNQPQNIPLNWHENIEIFSILEGSGVLAYDDQRLPIKKGDIALINSNHLHGVGSNGDLVTHCLIVDRQFCLSNFVDTNELQFEILFQDEALFRILDEIANDFRLPASSPYRALSIRAHMLSLLCGLCRDHSVPTSLHHRDPNSLDYIRKAIGYIRANYQEDLSLDKVADFVGISKYYFAREFRRITGYTFVTHLNMTRCEAAKELLSKDQMTIGAIAMSCGFSGQSYFTRTFQSLVGMLPGEYRERQRQKRQRMENR